MRRIPKKIWAPLLLLLAIGYLFFHNRPVMLQKAVLMSTPLISSGSIKSPWVSTDVILALTTGVPPAERGLVLKAGGTAWEFSDRYPQKIKGVAKPKVLIKHERDKE